jgi:hypothetical protein
MSDKGKILSKIDDYKSDKGRVFGNSLWFHLLEKNSCQRYLH